MRALLPMSRNRKQQKSSGRDGRESQRAPGGGRRRGTAAWIVAALALVANFPVLSADFVFDDHPIIEDNRRVTEVQLATIWRTSYWGTPERVGEYRPFVMSTFAVEQLLLGPAPGHFHAVNWLLHAVVALSLLFAGRAIGLGERAAVLAAGLFAVHPIHLDAIAPVVGRAELFAALALSAGTALWVRVRRDAEIRPGPLAGLAACVAMGAFSKETALAAVPLLAAVELLIVGVGSNRRTQVAATAAVALGVGAYLVVRVGVLGALLPSGGPSFTAVANPLVDESLGVRLLTAASIFGSYLRLFAWPANLSPDYSYDSLPVLRSAAEPAVWLPLALLAALLVLALACLRRRPAITAATVAFLAPYSIVANAAFPIGTMLAERLFYLPSLGLCWLIAAGVVATADRFVGGWSADPRRLAAAAALPALALTAASIERADDWRDEEGLYREALRVHPRNTAMWLTLGEIAIRKQQYAVGIERMARVTEIVPDFPKAWLDKGTMHAALGQLPPAREALLRAVELDPDNTLALRNLAAVQRELGDFDAGRMLDARAAAVDAARRPPQ
jgi:tetratricopeptide (TPR) repeat protein